MNKRTCSFPSCGRKHYGRGLCGGHYKQDREGKPLTPLSGRSLTLEQRFWVKVDKTDGCWLWIGATVSKGYGQFRVNGELMPAHRFAWELLVGPIPADYDIDHDYPSIGCGQPKCVNPAHLKPVPKGTNKHNGRGLQANNTSGHQGIYWYQQTAKWCVLIAKDRKKYHGGYFASLDDAIEARNALKAQLYGEAA